MAFIADRNRTKLTAFRRRLDFGAWAAAAVARRRMPEAQLRSVTNGSSKDANMAALPSFREEVAERFGVLPNFFCTAEAAPGLIERLWDFAKSAYLDNPLPSLFNERLFIHLSRFCVVRYCIVRHVGFLVGQGRPAGDGSVAPETVDEVIALLRS